METTRKVRATPCEGCRERKKKCDGGIPCQRCLKLSIPCQYSPSSSAANNPDKHPHYIQLPKNVKALENTIRQMEQELYLLKLALIEHKTTNTVRKPLKYLEVSPREDKAVVGPQPQSMKWNLSVDKNGLLSIHTNISTYTALLGQLNALANISQCVSLSSQPEFTSSHHLKRHGLSSILRRGLFHSIRKSIKARECLDHQSYPSPASLSDACKQQLALKLIDVYFQCQFMHQITFHADTFYDLFVIPYQHKERPSLVVYGLAAVALTMHCKHTTLMIPLSEQKELAEYYFDHVKQSLQFDEPSLELFICYLLMSYYKVNVLLPQEAALYLEMALRIRQILVETDYPPLHTENEIVFVPFMNELETFKRLHLGIQGVIEFIQYINNLRGVPVSQKQKKIEPIKFYTASFIKQFKKSCIQFYHATPLPNESAMTTRFIMRNKYIGMIRDIAGPYYHRVRHGAGDIVPLSYLVTVESRLKEVYYERIPYEYQLPVTLLGKGLSDVEFEKILRQHDHCDLTAVSLAAAFFQSLMSLYEPFIPVLSSKSSLADLTAPSDRTSSILHLVSSDSNEHGSLEDYAIRAQEECFYYAISVTRLLHYQCFVLNSCTLSIPVFLNAWDIHIRNSCLGMTLEEIENDTQLQHLGRDKVGRSREYAILCAEILRKGYRFNSAEAELQEYYEQIENQLRQTLNAATVNRSL